MGPGAAPWLRGRRLRQRGVGPRATAQGDVNREGGGGESLAGPSLGLVEKEARGRQGRVSNVR